MTTGVNDNLHLIYRPPASFTRHQRLRSRLLPYCVPLIFVLLFFVSIFVIDPVHASQTFQRVFGLLFLAIIAIIILAEVMYRIIIEKGLLHYFALGTFTILTIIFSYAFIYRVIIDKIVDLDTIMGASYIIMGLGFIYLLKKSPLHTPNPFCIYEEGISPPTKPGKWKYRKGLFIPYKDIRIIEIIDVWRGNKVPRKPFCFIIKTRNDEEFQISAGDLVVEYFGDNVNELRRTYDLLCKVKEELEKDENRKKFEKYEEIILKKELFDEILRSEYKITGKRIPKR